MTRKIDGNTEESWVIVLMFGEEGGPVFRISQWKTHLTSCQCEVWEGRQPLLERTAGETTSSRAARLCLE